MGARVTGLDLSQPISDTAENALKAAFLDHHLLCFESRPLSVEKFLVFRENFWYTSASTSFKSARQ